MLLSKLCERKDKTALM